MTPMIDIVFQLIAFFIFSLSFDPMPFQEAVQPPEWDDTRAEAIADFEQFVLEVDDDGRILGLDAPLSVTDPNFDAAVTARLQSVPATGLVVIRADQDAQFDVVKRLLSLCRRADRRRVGLQLKRVVPEP